MKTIHLRSPTTMSQRSRNSFGAVIPTPSNVTEREANAIRARVQENCHLPEPIGLRPQFGAAESKGKTDPVASTKLRKWGRREIQVVAVALISLVVILPRSISIVRSHSPCTDDFYHIERGALFWSRHLGSTDLNDPPLGEAIGAIPVSASDWLLLLPRFRKFVLSRDQAQLIVAIWKSIIFAPLVAIVFCWLRGLYGVGAGWFCAALIVFDPNVTAHLHLGAIDMLGAEVAVVALYAVSRCLDRPTTIRLLLASTAIAAAVLTKHTNILVPVVAVGYGAMRRVPFAVIVKLLAPIPVLMWALLLFDVSVPTVPRDWREAGWAAPTLLRHRVPCGLYIGSLWQARSHVASGHPGFLNGEIRDNGWWFYYFAVAAYKVPVATLLLIGVAAPSFLWKPMGRAELELILPAIVFAAALSMSPINIGFRHFLPAYLFVLMLSARIIAIIGIPGAVKAMAWIGLAAGAVHAASFHPDYLGYINWPRDKVWLRIGDSNLDWGQSLKEVKAWLEAHPQNRPVSVGAFYGGEPTQREVRRYIGKSVDARLIWDPPPQRGLLIASPTWVAGIYGFGDRYAEFRSRDPDAVIGRCMLVYDLDRIREESSPAHTQSSSPISQP